MGNPNSAEIGITHEAPKGERQPLQKRIEKLKAKRQKLPVEQPVHEEIREVRGELAEKIQAAEVTRDPLTDPDILFSTGPEQRVSFRDPTLPKKREALEHWEEEFDTGKSPAIKQAEEEAERLFQEQQEQKTRERQEREESERKRALEAEHVGTLTGRTKSILDAQRVRLGTAGKELRRDEHSDNGNELEWLPTKGPERYGKPGTEKSVTYDPRLTLTQLKRGDGDPLEVPREFSMTIAREGEVPDDKTPRLVIELEKGDITSVSFRGGYGRAGRDPRMFPQLFLDADSFYPLADVPINKLATFLDKDVQAGNNRHHDKDGNYYWSIGVDFSGELPEIVTRHNVQKFQGHESHIDGFGDKFKELNRPLPTYTGVYTFDKEANVFRSPYDSNKQFTVEEYEDILRSLFTTIPTDQEVGNNRHTDRHQSLEVPNDLVGKFTSLQEHGISLSDHVAPWELRTFKAEGMEGLMREQTRLEKIQDGLNSIPSERNKSLTPFDLWFQGPELNMSKRRIIYQFIHSRNEVQGTVIDKKEGKPYDRFARVKMAFGSDPEQKLKGLNQALDDAVNGNWRTAMKMYGDYYYSELLHYIDFFRVSSGTHPSQQWPQKIEALYEADPAFTRDFLAQKAQAGNPQVNEVVRNTLKSLE